MEIIIDEYESTCYEGLMIHKNDKYRYLLDVIKNEKRIRRDFTVEETLTPEEGLHTAYTYAKKLLSMR